MKKKTMTDLLAFSLCSDLTNYMIRLIEDMGVSHKGSFYTKHCGLKLMKFGLGDNQTVTVTDFMLLGLPLHRFYGIEHYTNFIADLAELSKLENNLVWVTYPYKHGEDELFTKLSEEGIGYSELETITLNLSNETSWEGLPRKKKWDIRDSIKNADTGGMHVETRILRGGYFTCDELDRWKEYWLASAEEVKDTEEYAESYMSSVFNVVSLLVLLKIKSNVVNMYTTEVTYNGVRVLTAIWSNLVGTDWITLNNVVTDRDVLDGIIGTKGKQVRCIHTAISNGFDFFKEKGFSVIDMMCDDADSGTQSSKIVSYKRRYKRESSYNGIKSLCLVTVNHLDDIGGDNVTCFINGKFNAGD